MLRVGCVTSKLDTPKSDRGSSSSSAEKDKIIITRFQQDTRREVLEADIKVLQYRTAQRKENGEPKTLFSIFDFSSNFDTLICDTHGPMPQDRCIEIFHLNFLQNEIVVEFEATRDGHLFKGIRYLVRYERTLPPELLKYIKSVHSKDTSKYIYPQSVALTHRHSTAVDHVDLNSQLLDKKYLKSTLLDHITVEIVYSCLVKELYTPSIIRKRGPGRKVQVEGFDENTARKLADCVETYARTYDCKPSVRVFISCVKYGDSLTWYVCHRYTHYSLLHAYVSDTVKSPLPSLDMRLVRDSVTTPSTLPSPTSLNLRNQRFSTVSLLRGAPSEPDLTMGRTSEFKSPTKRRSTSNTSVVDETPLKFDFPKKLFFGNNNPTECHLRKVKLEKFIQLLLQHRRRLSRNLGDLLLWFLDVPVQLQLFSDSSDSPGERNGSDGSFDKKVNRISAAARDAIRLRPPESQNLSLTIPDTITVATENPKIDTYPPVLRDQIKRALKGNGKKKSKLSFYFVEVCYGSSKWVLVYRFTEFQALHKFVVKELERTIKEQAATVAQLAVHADEDSREYDDASARLDKLNDSYRNLPHFPWKRIDILTPSEKVTNKRRVQFEVYLSYLIDCRAFYSETIANVLLQFLEFQHHYKHREHFTRGYKEMLSQPHEYTSLQADRASFGPPLKQSSLLGQRDKDALSPYMSYMRKHFSFASNGSMQYDPESSDLTNDEADEDEDEVDSDYNDNDSDTGTVEGGANGGGGGSTMNKISGLFKPLNFQPPSISTLIDKAARSVSRGKTRSGQETSDKPGKTRDPSRGKTRPESESPKGRSPSRTKPRTSETDKSGRSQSRGKTRVVYDPSDPPVLDNSVTSKVGDRSSSLRSPIFSHKDDN